MPRMGRVEAGPGEPQALIRLTVGPQALFRVLNARPSLTAAWNELTVHHVPPLLDVSRRKAGP